MLSEAFWTPNVASSQFEAKKRTRFAKQKLAQLRTGLTIAITWRKSHEKRDLECAARSAVSRRDSICTDKDIHPLSRVGQYYIIDRYVTDQNNRFFSMKTRCRIHIRHGLAISLYFLGFHCIRIRANGIAA